MIDLGSVVRIEADVREADGVLTDPDSAALTVTLPDGETAILPVPLPSDEPGRVRVDYVTTQAGRHVWRLVTTGPVTAYADVFDVRDMMPVGIVSLSDAKDMLNIDAPETEDDEELRGFITGASLAVERQIGRIVARRSFTERCRPDSRGRILLSNVPVMAVTSMQTPDGSTTWNPADIDADASTGLLTVTAGRGLTAQVDVTYTAGMRMVSEDYRLAALIIVQHLWETKRGRMGAIQGSADDPPYLFGRGFALPRRALELLDSTLPGVA
ncbi:hypothetical protein ACFC08_17650 [Streptomyces sp. NPDC056112]|uniref:hypothetical protein n=1 Tax=Streptomyces sp. NPDC056112 TaxID=3345715 RepID=UPI0035D60FAF